MAFRHSRHHQRMKGSGASVTAVLGRRTGKTHLAIERMVAHSSA
jgi:hypothetical protein